MRKNLLWIFLIVLLILSVLNGLGVNTIRVSAQVSPYIAVIPESTWNTSLTPGENYTVSIYTDYNGSDVWGYELTLNYDPNILNGTEVTNGDLITPEKDPLAAFNPGTFDNEEGFLSLTLAMFFFFPPTPPFVTSGPGVLANITFTVVGEGFSDITLGDETRLIGYDGDFYNIIDDTMLGQIQHGFFSNIPPTHDVAVVSLVAPGTATAEQPVPISVTVENEGTYDENVTLTVYNETTVIDTTTFTLEKGLNNTVSFSWDTSGLSPGSYTINATAAITSDDEPGDNSATQSVTLSMVHDVAVTSLVVPATAAIEQPVPISVTVANEGSYDENVILTVYNETAVIDTIAFILEKGPTSNTSSFSWDTSGLATAWYMINATATITVDEDLSDNTKTQQIRVTKLIDAAVIDVIPAEDHAYPGWTIPLSITVTVLNNGTDPANFTVRAYYENVTTAYEIGTQNVTDLSSGSQLNLTFNWNLAGVGWGLYTTKANVTLTGDVNSANDEFAYSNVTIKIPGDIQGDSGGAPGDGDVDGYDFGTFAYHYGQHYPAVKYNVECDFNRDGLIDAVDFGDLAYWYGTSTAKYP